RPVREPSEPSAMDRPGGLSHYLRHNPAQVLRRHASPVPMPKRPLIDASGRFKEGVLRGQRRTAHNETIRTWPVSSIPQQPIRNQLEKILASRAFVRSARMGRFLRYAVELALDGQSSDLKEYRVGVDVFDRKPEYDPRVDPIVRVEARRLREKLAAY